MGTSHLSSSTDSCRPNTPLWCPPDSISESSNVNNWQNCADSGFLVKELASEAGSWRRRDWTFPVFTSPRSRHLITQCPVSSTFTPHFHNQMVENFGFLSFLPFFVSLLPHHSNFFTIIPEQVIWPLPISIFSLNSENMKHVEKEQVNHLRGKNLSIHIQ